MLTDRSLRALREASPRSQAGFEEWLDRFDPLKEQIPAAAANAGLVREAAADVRAPAGMTRQVTRWRRRRLSLRSETFRRPGWLAVAAGTGGSLALAGVLLASGGSAPTRTNPVQLTAWTVSRQANGEITVTIRELKDPAGLQRELRADGVPASVRFSGHQNGACRAYPASRALLVRVYPVPYGVRSPGRVPPGAWHQVGAIPAGFKPQSALLYAVIRPSALPGGTGVQITSFSFSRSHPPFQKAIQAHPGFIQVSNSLGMVYASTECTGG
jgi:hypothetical protein